MPVLPRQVEAEVERHVAMEREAQAEQVQEWKQAGV